MPKLGMLPLDQVDDAATARFKRADFPNIPRAPTFPSRVANFFGLISYVRLSLYRTRRQFTVNNTSSSRLSCTYSCSSLSSVYLQYLNFLTFSLFLPTFSNVLHNNSVNYSSFSAFIMIIAFGAASSVSSSISVPSTSPASSLFTR